MAPDCPALPAYAIGATVPYWWSFARQWYEWEQIGTDCTECGCTGIDPTGSAGWQDCGDPPPGICVGVHDSPQTEWWGKWCSPVFGWKRHGPDWVLLDLTDYGWPTPYMLNPNVRLVPHPPCEPDPPVGVIYVPCIEVQAPIERQP